MSAHRSAWARRIRYATVLVAAGVATAAVLAPPGDRRGEFYASTGVKLRDFGASDDTLWISIETEPGLTYTTEFIGSRLEDGEPVEIGEVLATSTASRAEYRLTDDVLYVRARVTSSRPHPNPFAEGDMETAWIQPIIGPAAGER